MKPTEVFRTNNFQTAALACAWFGAATILLFGFIYWQTAGLETQRIDRFILAEFSSLSREPAASIAADVKGRYSADLHRQTFAAVFGPSGAPISGDLAALPAKLPIDGLPHAIEVVRQDGQRATVEKVRALAGRLADGRVLLIGRSERELVKLRILVLRALGLGLAPALAAALGIGVFASRRTISRVQAMNQSLARIMQGQLHERLPLAGSNDALDQLALGCNRMLAEIEHLLDEVKGVGDNIAHDLRTPLTRLRMRMETGRARSGSKAELDAVLARSIDDLDLSLGIITALLRIGELEGGRRRAGFGPVRLDGLVQEAAELYAPMAEERGLQFQATGSVQGEVQGDHDLLLEALVNLLDNAVKFAPAGGSVSIVLAREDSVPVIRVIDSGRGIAATERPVVAERFYRSEPSRHVAGSGVGLSLVTAILRLHGFALRMSNIEAGFAVDILCGSKAGNRMEGEPAAGSPSIRRQIR